MNYRNYKSIDSCFKELIKEKKDYIERIATFDDEQIDIVATYILLSLFINERGNVGYLQQDNADTISPGIKKNYKNFNPELVMGYQISQQKDGVKVVIDRSKPFRICSTDGMDMEKLLMTGNIFRSVANKVLEEINLPKIPYDTDCGMDILSSFANGSSYLYDKYNKELYFKGIFPTSVKKEDYDVLVKCSSDEIAEFLAKQKKTETRHYNSMEEAYKDIFPFNEFVSSLSNCLSHGRQIDKGDFIFIRRKRDSEDSFIVSKAWLKAVAESLMRAKEQYASPEHIMEKINECEAKYGKLKLNKNLIRNLLTTTFDISDYALGFMVRLIEIRLKDDVTKNMNLTKRGYEKLSTLLYIYQENFNNDRLQTGIALPSKPFMYLLSIVEEAYYKKHIIENPAFAKAVKRDFPDELYLAIKNRVNTSFSLNKKSMIKSIQGIAETSSKKYQERMNKGFQFYQHNFIYEICDLKSNDVIQEELENAIVYSSLSRKVNNAYEGLTKPISRISILSNIEDYTSEIEFNDSKRKSATSRRALQYVMSSHPEFLEDFSLWINGRKAIINPKNSDYTYSKNIGQIRNSYSHSAISLLIDNDGKLVFVFNDLRGLDTYPSDMRNRDAERNRTAIYKIKCNPLKLFNFFTSGLFDSRVIPVPEFFGTLHDYKDVISFSGENRIYSFDKKGMTVISKKDKNVELETYDYSSKKMKKLGKLL